MEKCLYVSDLDGTLLRSDETISDYTCSVINKLTQSGMLFSYATARSYVTAKKVTKGLGAKIPLIVYNGAFVIDNLSEEVLISNFFPNDIKNVWKNFFQMKYILSSTLILMRWSTFHLFRESVLKE